MLPPSGRLHAPGYVPSSRREKDLTLAPPLPSTRFRVCLLPASIAGSLVCASTATPTTMHARTGVWRAARSRGSSRPACTCVAAPTPCWQRASACGCPGGRGGGHRMRSPHPLPKETKGAHFFSMGLFSILEAGLLRMRPCWPSAPLGAEEHFLDMFLVDLPLSPHQAIN